MDFVLTLANGNLETQRIMKKDISRRLKAEAQFQNMRSSGELDEYEQRRNKFYFLIRDAKELYDNLLMKSAHNKNVLVVGCAEGGVTPIARAGAQKVIGVDIADVPIKKLNESIEKEGLSHKAKGIVANAEALELAPESIDVICCSGVLHHLDIEAAISSWSKVLSKEGLVIMMEPMAYSPLVALYRFFTPKMRSVDEHPLKPSDFKIMRKYFDDVQINGYVLFSLATLVFVYLPFPESVRNAVWRALERFDQFVLKILPILKYGSWTSVIVLKKPSHA